MTKLNLACGDIFVQNDQNWINLDYSPSDFSVRKANLLGRLPFSNASIEMVYSSHFLEHISYSRVPIFLTECFRVLKSGGVMRLVFPDFENMCQAYLDCRKSGEHDKANFVILEMIDQCVRSNPGGELGLLYRRLKNNPNVDNEMISFVRERTGENVLTQSSEKTHNPFLMRLKPFFRHQWILAVIKLLPKAFQFQNISLATIGERHHWLWDFYQIRVALESSGFVKIERVDCMHSRVDNFPFHILDLDEDGLPRKGKESLFVEAQKP